MKTRMVEERIGEYMGPVDWSYDFASHFTGTSLRDGELEKRIAQKLEWLRAMEAEPEAYEATTDGGWPRFGWFKVLQVGMYDGWPYWRPVPAVLTCSPLGTAWHHFDMITGIQKAAAREAQ